MFRRVEIARGIGGAEFFVLEKAMKTAQRREVTGPAAGSEPLLGEEGHVLEHVFARDRLDLHFALVELGEVAVHVGRVGVDGLGREVALGAQEADVEIEELQLHRGESGIATRSHR